MVTAASASKTSDLASTAKALDALQRVVDVVRREGHSEMPAQTLEALLWIHFHPGSPQHKMREALEISEAAASRIANRLSEKEKWNKPGLGFISNERNPQRRTESLMYLTPKGQRFMQKLAAAMSGH